MPRSAVAEGVANALFELTQGSAGRAPDEREIFDRLVPLVYDELRVMARSKLRAGSGLHTLDTTGLVNEAYLRLAQSPKLPLRGRAYFFGAASHAMRSVLVDAARRRRRQKRGGGVEPATLDEASTETRRTADEILVLDDLLDRLATDHPRPARVFEARYFAGLTVNEIAETLDISRRTAHRDETFARAWLRREMKESARESSELA